MGTDDGRKISLAIQAILEMHEDCIRLFNEIDKGIGDYHPLPQYANVVTSDLGSTMYRRRYMAYGLFRIYSQQGHERDFLGVNLCFFNDNDPTFVEPLFVAGLSHYDHTWEFKKEDKPDLSWDPWNAFLVWNASREFGVPITIARPAKRSSIETITVAAAPLYSIRSFDNAKHILKLVEPTLI